MELLETFIYVQEDIFRKIPDEMVCSISHLLRASSHQGARLSTETQ